MKITLITISICVTTLVPRLLLGAGMNDGPIAHFRLNGDALDSSGNGRHGTNTGVPFATATNGMGAVFDGVPSRHVRVDAPLPIISSLTIAAWFKPQNLTRFSVGSPLLTKGQSGGEAYILFADYDFLYGVLNGGYGDVGTFRTSIPRLSDGVFYHAAMVYDAAAHKVRIYLNGVLQAEFDYAQPIHPRNEPLYLGYSPAGGVEVFKGMLDDVRLYDRPLNDAEIFALFAVPPRLAIRTSQIELCWDTYSNKTYQVQFRPSLGTNTWNNLGSPILGSGGRQCMFDAVAVAEPQRVYRVLIAP